MRTVVLVITLLLVLSGCVSAKEYKVLADKYAHTLAVKNEIDQEYGALRKEVVALEQGHGRLATALADHQQTNTAIHTQLANEVEAAKVAGQKSDQAVRELRTALDQLKTSVELGQSDQRRGIADLRSKLEQVQQDLMSRVEALQAQLRTIDGRLVKLTSKVKTLRAADSTPSEQESDPFGAKEEKTKAGKPGGKAANGKAAEKASPEAASEKAQPLAPKTEDIGPSPMMEQLKPPLAPGSK